MFHWVKRSITPRRKKGDSNLSKTDSKECSMDELKTDEEIITPEYKKALAEFHARRSSGHDSSLDCSYYEKPQLGRKSYNGIGKVQSEPKPKMHSLPMVSNAVPKIQLLFDNNIYALCGEKKKKKRKSLPISPPDILSPSFSAIVNNEWEASDDDVLTSSPPLGFYKRNSMPFKEENNDDDSSKISEEKQDSTEKSYISIKAQMRKINTKAKSIYYNVLVISEDDLTVFDVDTTEDTGWSFGEIAETPVSVKRCHRNNDLDHLNYAELAVSFEIRHKNILPLMGLIRDELNMTMKYFIFENYTMTLSNLIENKGASVVEYVEHLANISNALVYLTKIGKIIHTAVSTESIVITDNSVAKLTSFEFCYRFNASQSPKDPEYVNMKELAVLNNNELALNGVGQKLKDREICSTTCRKFRFNAPEMFEEIDGLVYPTITTDVYSLCAVLYNCLTNEEPFKKYSYQELSDMYILWQHGIRLGEDFIKEYPEIIHNILFQGLAVKHSERMNIQCLSDMLKKALVHLEGSGVTKILNDSEMSISVETIDFENHEDVSPVSTTIPVIQEEPENVEALDAKSQNNDSRANSTNNSNSTEYCPLFTPEIRRFLSRTTIDESKNFQSKFSFDSTASTKSVDSNQTSVDLQPKDFSSLPVELESTEKHGDPYASLDFNAKISLFDKNKPVNHKGDVNTRKKFEFKNIEKPIEKKCEKVEDINSNIDVDVLVALHEKLISEHHDDPVSKCLSLPTGYRGCTVAVKPASHHIDYGLINHVSGSAKKRIHSLSFRTKGMRFNDGKPLNSKFDSSTPFLKDQKSSPGLNESLRDTSFYALTKSNDLNENEQIIHNIKPSSVITFLKNKNKSEINDKIAFSITGNKTTEPKILVNESRCTEDIYIDDEFPVTVNEERPPETVLSPNMQLIPLHTKHQALCVNMSQCCISQLQELTFSDKIYIVCQRDSRIAPKQTEGRRASLSETERIIVDAICHTPAAESTDKTPEDEDVSIFLYDISDESSTSNNLKINDSFTDDAVQL